VGVPRNLWTTRRLPVPAAPDGARDVTVRQRRQRDGAARHILSPPTSEVTMVAIIGAVLFGLALLFQLAGISVPVLTADVLITAGLLCVALHLAGIGTTRRARSRR
jgi:hypothetical protein